MDDYLGPGQYPYNPPYTDPQYPAPSGPPPTIVPPYSKVATPSQYNDHDAKDRPEKWDEETL